MAPSKPRTASSKGSSTKGSSTKGSSTKPTIKRTSRPTGAGSSSKSKTKPSITRPATQRKTKSTLGPARKKKRVYSEKELGIPKLNMITPAGVQKPRGKKKGKVFVDDQESMMTILAMVNADKEGQIESKMMKARQMEEIRQARQNEMEARQEERKSKFEETKDSLRRPRNRKGKAPDAEAVENIDVTKPLKMKKRVSFG